MHALARDDVITCPLEAPIAGLAEQIEASPYGFALVITAGGTLLGRLRRSKLEGVEPQTPVEQVMDPGPSTVRADTSVAELLERLEERDLRTALVSTPEGKLIGVVTRERLRDRAG